MYLFPAPLRVIDMTSLFPPQALHRESYTSVASRIEHESCSSCSVGSHRDSLNVVPRAGLGGSTWYVIGNPNGVFFASVFFGEDARGTNEARRGAAPESSVGRVIQRWRRLSRFRAITPGRDAHGPYVRVEIIDEDFTRFVSKLCAVRIRSRWTTRDARKIVTFGVSLTRIFYTLSFGQSKRALRAFGLLLELF